MNETRRAGLVMVVQLCCVAPISLTLVAFGLFVCIIPFFIPFGVILIGFGAALTKWPITRYIKKTNDHQAVKERWQGSTRKREHKDEGPYPWEEELPPLEEL